MGLLIRNILFFMVISFQMAAFATAQEYIYLPQPLTGNEEEQISKDGVLVREVIVNNRDTLSGISKRYSGKGIYYPQILLFNSIRNPHLIHPGDILRVPVNSKNSSIGKKKRQEIAGAALPVPQKTAEPGYAKKTPSLEAPVSANPVSAEKVAAETTKPMEIGREEQTRYARALAAARKGNCKEAITLFNEFIRLYPQSQLMAEASLNRAECYLNMSGQ